MPGLQGQVIEAAAKKVRVQYLDRETAKWWNQRRKSDDTRVYCGWYWTARKGLEEAGPFPTEGAAYRDAYYRFILGREVPSALHSRPDSVFRRLKSKARV